MVRLLVLFFFSGCAALIYETVWFYLVQLVVGASSISVAVLLCALMGGMAIGSWLLPRALSAVEGKLTPSRSRPFRVVAALELGIAIFGVTIPLGLHDTVVATSVAITINVIVAAAFWRLAASRTGTRC